MILPLLLAAAFLAADQPAPTVVFYDLMNTAPDARAEIQKQIFQSVERLGPNPPVLLCLLTADGNVVAVPAPTAAALADSLRSVVVLRPPALDAVGARVQATYQALAVLSDGLKVYTGPKRVVWITHGVPLYLPQTDRLPVDYTPILKKVAGGLHDAGVVLCPVQETLGASIAVESAETLKQFAKLTGGRVYRPHEIEKAIRNQ